MRASKAKGLRRIGRISQNLRPWKDLSGEQQRGSTLLTFFGKSGWILKKDLMYSTSDIFELDGRLNSGGWLTDNSLDFDWDKRGPALKKHFSIRFTFKVPTPRSTSKAVYHMYHDVHRLLIPLLYETKKYGGTKTCKTCDILDCYTDSRTSGSLKSFAILVPVSCKDVNQRTGKKDPERTYVC